MTRSDALALAAILRKHQAPLPLIHNIADYCALDNPYFDRDRFYLAAGLPRHA